ncbi:S26 family signal peptidase [Heyndrickxia vini]|uniref:Peptidase S26 domain-containing protein n=1 Tax=Heyndrickxia vini TaxID=1476025 RepID=A0ABX7E2Y8_9BACI|nr:S26 family signal peptidase [Heyndrickxia vini]QQZ08707.1 hypothetical protein I5776_16965 [Heyndrickxia vini]
MKRLPLLITIAFLLAGCSYQSSAKTVSDSRTDLNIAIINNLEPNMLTFHHMSDSMDRGNHEYSDNVIVFDPTKKDFQRGAIVLFKDKSGEKRITRIVALPHEQVTIKEGQIFINDQKLDTFYGSVHRLGSKKEEYFKEMDKNNADYNKNVMTKFFEQDKSKIVLQENEFFTTGDDWLRSEQKVVKKSDIIGVVLGYKN